MVSRVYYPQFSAAEYEARWKRVRTKMAARNLDCLLVYGAYSSAIGTDPGQSNVRYLTNFVDQFHDYCIFTREGSPILINSFNGHIESGSEASFVKDIRLGHVRIIDKVISVLAELNLQNATIGIVGINKEREVSIPYEHRIKLAEALPKARLEDATHFMEDIRRKKSEEEIEFLRRGAAITDRAFEAQMRATKPGATNVDLYNEILFETHRQYGMLTFALLGATSMANPDLVFPDPYISDRPISAGDVIINEMSSGYGGYSGQLLRTVFVGDPPPEYRRMFDVALDAFHRVKAAVKDGATTADVQDAASVIVDKGYTVSAPIVHGWSYFVEPPATMGVRGTTGNPQPVVDWTFREGDTIVIQPNPCTPDFKSGVFLGDLCVVTKNGAESLHTYPINDPIIVRGF